MNYKYGGKDYDLRLNDDGLIECREMNAKAPTIDEVKKLIREQVEKEKSLPRVSVLTFGDGYHKDETQYFVGSSTLKNVGTTSYKQIWVTYKDAKGKVNRFKGAEYYTYQDTPENRERLDRYVELKKQIALLEEQASELQGECTHISAIQV